MNKQVTNCSNCPMAQYGGGKYADMYYCNLDPTLERGIRVLHDEEEEADKLPAPSDCPLRNCAVLIQLNPINTPSK